MRRVWAAAERIIPRGVVAATTLVAAAATDPKSIGIYTWAILATTFLGTLTDSPMRQLAVQYLGSPAGLRTLRRSALVVGSVGLLLIIGAVALISTYVDESYFWSLISLALVPPAQAGAMEPTAALQKAGSWGEISLARAIGSLCGTSIGIPVILLTQSITGACIAVAASELVYTIAVFYRVRRPRESSPIVEVGDDTANISVFWASYRHMAVYSALGWLQGNADRWLMGVWAGTSVLGTYSLGSAIGRSAGEAIAVSQLNVLRVDLAQAGASTDAEIRLILARNLRSESVLILVSAALTLSLSTYVLVHFLGPEWSEVFQIVPILVLTAIPLAVATSSGPVHLQRGNSRIASVGPAVCLFFAPAVAFAAMTSLTVAAWIYLLRECVLALIQCALMGRATPWREVGFAAVVVGLGSVAVLTLI